MALLSLLLKVGTTVFVAYKLRTGSRFSVRGIAAYALAAAGVLALFGGYDLAVREESRLRYGHVYQGVIVEMFSSSGERGSRPIGRSGGRNQALTRKVVTINGFRSFEVLARLVVTGSPAAWVVDYRFACERAQPCVGRDWVSEDEWLRLSPGQAINVRRAEDEDGTSRLDDNPQWTIAAAELGIAAVLLLSAGFLSGQIAPFRRSEWLVVPAVVTAVEPVAYKEDTTRLRVRFAYFDRDGAPQESADEVVTGSWKPGDDCEAVFRAQEPGLATLRRAVSH